MALAERCAAEFETGDWRRGAEYFSSDAVIIHKQSTTRVTADVEGSRAAPYRVIIDWKDIDDGFIDVCCDCPRFEDGVNCKHIAAVIRVIDEIGLAGSFRGRRRLTVCQMMPHEIEEAEVAGGKRDGVKPENFESRARQILGGFLGRGISSNGGKPKTKSSQRPPEPPQWKKQLAELVHLQSKQPPERIDYQSQQKKARQLWFQLDLAESSRRGAVFVAFHQRVIKADGTPGKLTAAKISRHDYQFVESVADRELLGLVLGNKLAGPATYGNYGGYYDYTGGEYLGAEISGPQLETILPRLAASGRFGLLAADERHETTIEPLTWDDGPPWRFELKVHVTEDQRNFEIQGQLKRGEEVRPWSDALAAMRSGVIVFSDTLARYDANGVTGWQDLLRRAGEFRVPVKEAAELAHHFCATPRTAFAELPEALDYREVQEPPTPRLTIKRPTGRDRSPDLLCQLSYRYGDWEIDETDEAQGQWRDADRLVVRRDWAAESASAELLRRAGVRFENRYGYGYGYDRALARVVAPKKLPALIALLAEQGWSVEAEGKLIRRPGEFHIDVTSGVDWFDLAATCDFEGVSASLPQLLAAVRKGEQFVTLDDGTQGMLPTEWLKRFAPLAELGQTEKETLRFVPAQAALLDALLAEQDAKTVSFDKQFKQLRDRLRAFDGVAPSNAPKSFQGELRPYQRDGLGWLHFLRDFNFGGCLADDMGLGKTIQVLALLEQRRTRRGAKDAPPSLVVSPKSLVFNWIEEAKRFTPAMRVLNYTGLERDELRKQFDEHDLIVTTYGTMRMDVAHLRKFRFDYAILDEAQAIKNASSLAAKAGRLLQADHRLAMTGTPVENHLGELWSLLDYLNPGMLGACGRLTDLFVNGRAGRSNEAQQQEKAEAVKLLGRALRPFLLRRTKQQVLKDLPEKTEQTLHCELDVKQRNLYDELREHYRRSLMEKVAKSGVNKSKIHVLEALLRLRQAACHPGLLDPKRAKEGSAKLDTLLEQLEEVLAEGHKALVFSQFTSLLAIVRQQLDARGVTYEYLDGKTRDRQARVERFQSDDACRLFLISLKAGGQGLNLTAADYVFILDPWWNPAVEAQAVDRAHRLGQQRPVTAYRLIARDTVEEKILQLQAQKKDLADAIVSADNSVLRNLTTEDLQLLLS